MKKLFCVVAALLAFTGHAGEAHKQNFNESTEKILYDFWRQTPIDPEFGAELQDFACIAGTSNYATSHARSTSLDSLPLDSLGHIAQLVKTANSETLDQRFQHSQVLNLVNKTLRRANNAVPPEEKIAQSLIIRSTSHKACLDLAEKYRIHPAAIYALFLTDRALDLAENIQIMDKQPCLAATLMLVEYKFLRTADPDKKYSDALLGDQRMAKCLKRLFSLPHWYVATKKAESTVYEFGPGYKSIIDQKEYYSFLKAFINHQYAETLEILLEQKFPTSLYGTVGSPEWLWKGIHYAQEAVAIQKILATQTESPTEKLSAAQRILTLFETHTNYLIHNPYALVPQNLVHQEPKLVYP